MKKGYWISLYIKIVNQENLKKYAETVTPIIKSYGGVPLVRGGKYQFYNGDEFIRTVVWEFPSYEKAIECHNSKEYQAGWSLAKDTTKRHMQVIEGLESDIDHLFLNIMDDITHTGVTRLFKDTIPKRDFSEWSMGFKRSSSEKLDGFSEFMSLKNECNLPSGKAKILLLGFK